MFKQLTGFSLGIVAACLIPSAAWGAQLDFSVNPVSNQVFHNVDIDDVSEVENDKGQWQQVEKLIKQLSSSSFAQRHSAIEQLWQLGPGITKPLESALNHPDPEVVKRLKIILDAFELGLDSTTPRSTALTILYFENGTAEVREQIIRNLESRYEYGTIFDLLSRVKDPTARKELYTEEIALDSTIYRLAIQEKWDVINEILTHEIPWKFDFRLCIHYAQLNGTVDAKIAQLRSSVERDAERFSTTPDPTQPASNENRNNPPALTDEQLARQEFQSDLMLLIRLLRVTGNRRDAIEYAYKVDNDALRHRFIHRMLMEQGDWKVLETKLSDSDPKAPVTPDQLKTSLGQRALVHYFAGNSEAFENVVARMIEKTTQTSAPNAEQQPQADLMDVLLVTTDWDRAKKYVDDKNRLETFQLYSLLQRNEQALESIGLTDDANQRINWFQRLARRLDSVFCQYERVSSDRNIERQIYKRIGMPVLDQDAVHRKADSIFQLGVAVAQQLGSLGFTDEAVLHLRTLADTIDTNAPGSREKRLKILSALVDMSEFEQAWQLVEQRFSKSEYQVMLRYMFPNKSSHARFWRNVVARIYPDPLDQMKAVASILNSPLQTPEVQVDVQEILAQVDGSLASSNRNTRRLTHYQIAMAHFFHGNFQLSHKHMVRSAEERNYVAETFLANLAFETDNFERAATIFDRLWKRTVSSEANTYAAAAAAACYERLGDYEKARQRKLVAYASWLDSYRTENIIQQFESHNCGDRLAPMLNISVHASPSSSLTNEYYRHALANSQIDQEPADSVANWRIYLFNRLATSSSSGRRFVAIMAGHLKRAEAMASLKSGDVTGAEAILDIYNRFRPGDPEISEKLIPILDELGRTDLADKQFEQIANYYTQTLSRYPDSPLHNNNYAWVCATSKRRVKFAKYHSDLAVKLRHGNSSYLDTLAEILYLQGEEELAQQLGQECLQIHPGKRHYQMQFLRFGGRLY